VNFTFHRHLAERDSESAVVGLGAMLPDLWRMADRRVRPRRELRVSSSEAPLLVALEQGLHHHTAVDAWFHRRDEFALGESSLRAALRGASRAPKLGLFAHAAWEMCLDGALVRRVGLEVELARLKHALRDVGEEHARSGESPLRRLAHLHHFVDAHEHGRRLRFDELLGRMLTELERGAWIGGYTTGPGLAARLGGMRARLGFGAPASADLSAWAAVFDEVAPLADESAASLLSAWPP
jgi:hypothetical protein